MHTYKINATIRKMKTNERKDISFDVVSSNTIDDIYRKVYSFADLEPFLIESLKLIRSVENGNAGT